MYYIQHYGMPRRSGRYPYGSGDRPYQSLNIKNSEKVEESRDRLEKNTEHRLTNDLLTHYIKQYRNLSHIKVDNSTNGLLYEKDDKVVAMVNTEKKPDGTVWIQGLEVFGDNKGRGLSRGLLDVAVKDLGATNLSVRNTNQLAKKIYEEYGFKTYSSDDFMDYMSIKNIKHSQEGEVNFKMNDFYYLIHGGPGSGRYPLGSGERPYQMLEGSRKKRSSLLSYIQSKRREKADGVKQKTEEEYRAEKERALKSGKASDILKFQGDVSNEELQRAITRLNLESQLKSMSAREMQTAMDKIDVAMKNIERGTKWVQTGTNAYNTFAALYNATPDGKKKPLTLVGKGGGGNQEDKKNKNKNKNR